jgi:transposase
MDVHKNTVVVHLRKGRKGETRTYRTMTRNLVEMKEWLTANGVTQVAMESTGVYWKPLYHQWEGSFGSLLVNAPHVKNVPGRKTDVKDAEWLADLLPQGWLRAR